MDFQPAPWWRMQQPYDWDQTTLFSDDFSSEVPNAQHVTSFVIRRPQQDIWSADGASELTEGEESHSCSWQDAKPTQPTEARTVTNALEAYPFETQWKMDEINKSQHAWRSAEPKHLASNSDIQNRLKIRNREKRRCQAMRCAFEKLRHHIPFVPLDKGVPKITTLRLAIQYIVHLRKTLSSDEACTSVRKFSDVVLEEVHRKNRYASSV
ncbi:hypothetical protein M514_01574 [Trichuris suis]|uniref:BHLH domain-containing protein n=1 Tax=Trichuris suis TaxID=68888 RepID=A0A085NAT2_9BILA|nr:hypothetical protein M514_01574 [Trichuris suis]KHJ49127.1 hypothetical protein D918_00245 [Trichuris suis]